jgi:hypothetical protein
MTTSVSCAHRPVCVISCGCLEHEIGYLFWSLADPMRPTGCSSSSGSTVLYGPWPPWWSSPRYSYQVLSSNMLLLSITLQLLRHYQATLIWVFPFSETHQAARRLSFCKANFTPFCLNVLAILSWPFLLIWLYLDVYTKNWLFILLLSTDMGICV